MSFILDALRKVDQEHRHSAEVVPPVAAVERLRKERLHRRRQFAAMAVIAMVSAAFTALLLRRPPSAESPPPAPGAQSAGVEAALASPVVEPELPSGEGIVPARVERRAPNPPPVAAAKPEAPVERRTKAPVVPAADPPPELPRLVLQGTSVLGGKPVAVVSDRRVFEGDTIEGAVVIRIEERSVTLEFEGRRFTLTL
jgi:hypothetical protein